MQGNKVGSQSNRKDMNMESGCGVTRQPITTWLPQIESSEFCHSSPKRTVKNKWLLRFLQILRSNNIQTTSHCSSFKLLIMEHFKTYKSKRWREEYAWPSCPTDQHVASPAASVRLPPPRRSTWKQTLDIIPFSEYSERNCAELWKENDSYFLKVKLLNVPW